MKSILIGLSFCISLGGWLGQKYTAEGLASYYSASFNGKLTASGEKFHNDSLTAAHPNLPFNTKIRVTNLENGREVIVKVNDRGPFVKGRIIDLSQSAASQLGFLERGICKVTIEIIGEQK